MPNCLCTYKGTYPPVPNDYVPPVPNCLCTYKGTYPHVPNFLFTYKGTYTSCA